MTMAFQFQAVGALSPAFQEAFSVGVTDIGILIGLYFAPGLFLAAPGGAPGRRGGEGSPMRKDFDGHRVRSSKQRLQGAT